MASRYSDYELKLRVGGYVDCMRSSISWIVLRSSWSTGVGGKDEVERFPRGQARLPKRLDSRVVPASRSQEHTAILQDARCSSFSNFTSMYLYLYLCLLPQIGRFKPNPPLLMP